MYISNERYMDFNGVVWLVNSKPSGLYSAMAKRCFDQFFNMLSHYSRIHVIRFDLHQKHYNLDNSRISQFIRRLFKRLKSRYRLVRIGYCWVREQEKAEAQHYHFALFLDQRVIKYPKRLLKIVATIWDEMSGFCFVPKHCFYNVNRNDFRMIQKVIYRLSYFAKVRGKKMQPTQTKNFSTSRIKRNLIPS